MDPDFCRCFWRSRNRGRCWFEPVELERTREQVTSEDVTFWVNKVLAPKYGLDDLNANNVASFLKELELNWAKLPTDLKDKVVDLMVEQIFPQNYEFAQAVMSRVAPPQPIVEDEVVGDGEVKETFGATGGVSTSTMVTLISGGLSALFLSSCL